MALGHTNITDNIHYDQLHSYPINELQTELANERGLLRHAQDELAALDRYGKPGGALRHIVRTRRGRVNALKTEINNRLKRQ